MDFVRAVVKIGQNKLPVLLLECYRSGVIGLAAL